MKKAVLAFLLLLALPLAACKPPAAPLSFLPLHYESEEAFVKDVALAREEHSAGVKAEDYMKAVDKESDLIKRRAMYDLHTRTFYLRFSEVPSGYAFRSISSNNSYVSTLYARTDTAEGMEGTDYPYVVLTYFNFYSPEGATAFIARNSGAPNDIRSVDGRTYYILHVGKTDEKSGYTSKWVDAQVGGDMVNICAPISMSDEDIIKLFDQVEKVPIP